MKNESTDCVLFWTASVFLGLVEPEDLSGVPALRKFLQNRQRVKIIINVTTATFDFCSHSKLKKTRHLHSNVEATLCLFLYFLYLKVSMKPEILSRKSVGSFRNLPEDV